MAHAREIKLRMKSIKQTRQITRAMKLISAANMKRARKQLEQTLPYFKKVKETMADIIARSSGISSIYFDVLDVKKADRKAYIVLSGDKGLAGGYNINIFKLTDAMLNEEKDPLLLVAGQVGRSYFSRKGRTLLDDFNYPVANPDFERAAKITDTLLSLYESRTVDEIYLIYTEVITALKFEPRIIKLLPLELEALKNDIGVDIGIKSEILYEPSPEAVLDVLIPKYLIGVIYGALVEAFTSEQTARMTAMDNATSNADEMLRKLTLHYNRARQAAITQEISEIVGGASALN